MNQPKTARKITIESLPPGMSQEALDQHYDVLYKGYVNKYNEIQELLEEADVAGGNATYSQYRELKREEIFAANAIQLHEAYFESIGGDGRCTGMIAAWLTENFGSVEEWADRWRACGMSARGWVVLACSMNDGRLHNYTLDIHSDGIWNAVPLLVMDVYEHAYYLDFEASGRKAYIDSFIAASNWAHVNRLVEQLESTKIRDVA
jgi:Fe-Mn family superoxide dismutase